MYDWMVWARDDQLPPPQPADGIWRTWLVLGGRGAGKTRTGAEWVRAVALGRTPLADFKAHRIALVGLTLGQVRSVMVEGVSGLLSVHCAAEQPRFEVATNTITWPNGTIAQMFAADDPDSLRGPQFDAAWCDELAKWRRAERVWDNLQLALRLGPSPLAVVTTTPRPLPLLKRLLEDTATVVSRSKTADNSANLAPRFVADMQRRYGATALGRQELAGRSASGVRMLFQHDPGEPIGVWQTLAEDAKGLFARGRLMPEVTRAREVLSLMRAGAIDGLSIGFKAIRSRRDRVSGVRRLEKIDLWEISIVTFPMLPDARITGIKTRVVPRIHEADLAARLSRVTATLRSMTSSHRKI